VDLLESLDAPAYKIASPELIDLPLIRWVAQTGKPIVISTGMGNLEEIGEAVDAARGAGATEIIVLHCTSAYPTPASEANLATIAEISRRFGVVAGLSDHTMGNIVPALAVALGADIIEKHFTLARADGGVDSAFSMEPAELADLVVACRTARVAVGHPAFAPTQSEVSVLSNRRSLYIVADMRKDEVFTALNLRSIRPGLGLKPKFYDAVLGKRATRDLSYGEPLSADMIEGGN
jgi:N-acetylneuraminate synthase